MTKFYKYLNENRSKTMDINDAFPYIKNNCSEILDNYSKNKNYIFRGVNVGNTFSLIVEPIKSVRMSANTKNYYTLLFDEILSSWNPYPDRSKSIICTTDEGQATGYGYVHIVFPENGSKIGICPEEDIWDSFDIGGCLDTFNIMLRHGFEYMNVYNMSLEQDPKELVKALNNFKDLIHQDDVFFDFMHYRNPRMSTFLYSLKQSGPSVNMIDFLNNEMSPRKNNFKLKTTKTWTSIISEVEVWTDGTSILINLDEINQPIDSFIKMIKEW